MVTVSRAPTDGVSDRWRAGHGAVLLTLLLLPLGFPALTQWPLYLLVPVVLYLALVVLVGPLRRSFAIRAGGVGAGELWVTLGIVAVSSAALVGHYFLFRPDVGTILTRLPSGTGSSLLVTAGFVLLNATLEEFVFRGVLYDSLAAEWGWPVALFVTSAVFGYLHLGGYPPGPVGAVLAGLYGLILGLLRQHTGGLLLPVLAHGCADATIVGIVLHAGAV